MAPLKKSIFLCFIFSLILCFTSCRGIPQQADFSYLEKSESLSVRGRLSLTYKSPVTYTHDVPYYPGITRTGETLDFTALIHISPTKPGVVVSNVIASDAAFDIRIVYTSPSSLNGLQISCIYSPFQDKDDLAQVKAELSYPSPTGDLHMTIPVPQVMPLLQPALCLIPQGDLTSIIPGEENALTYVYTSPDAEINLAFIKEQSCPKKIQVKSKNRDLILYVDETKK